MQFPSLKVEIIEAVELTARGWKSTSRKASISFHRFIKNAVWFCVEERGLMWRDPR